MPFYSMESPRIQLQDFFLKKEVLDRDYGGRAPNGLQSYWEEKNDKSIDGLPGLRLGQARTQGYGLNLISAIMGSWDIMSTSAMTGFVAGLLIGVMCFARAR